MEPLGCHRGRVGCREVGLGHWPPLLTRFGGPMESAMVGVVTCTCRAVPQPRPPLSPALYHFCQKSVSLETLT